MKHYRPHPRHKKPKPIGELVAPLMSAAAVACANNIECPSERKRFLTEQYELGRITGDMLAELITLHGLEGA